MSDLVQRLRSVGGTFDGPASEFVTCAETANEIERLRLIETAAYAVIAWCDEAEAATSLYCIAQLREALAGVSGQLRCCPLNPTPEMIEAGAQRLVHWEGECEWPKSWSSLQVRAARNDAERVWRSMWLATPNASCTPDDA